MGEPLPWPASVVLAAFARKAGIDPDRLERMTIGNEPWSADVLPKLTAALAEIESVDWKLSSETHRNKVS